MPKFPLPNRRLLFSCLLLLAVSLLAPLEAQAQQPSSGFELALHGSTQVVAGRAAKFRGTAYRVRGLSQLQPLAGARVRARITKKLSTIGSWQDLRADTDGLFQIDLLAPTELEGDWFLEVSVGDGKSQREFRFDLGLVHPEKIDLVTDRALYEPGETIHVWTRIRDLQSRRPIAGKTVRFSLDLAGVKGQSHTTAQSGVAATTIVVPKEAKDGHYDLYATIGGRTESSRIKIGTRSYERLFAEVSVSPETAAPHQEVQIDVKVATASGALVRNASVEIEVGSVTQVARTNAQGIATTRIDAPAYLTHRTGSVAIKAKVSHAAHGETVAFGRLGIEVPLTLSVEAVPGNGGLVPGLSGFLYVRLSRGQNKPAPVGTPVEVTGAAIAGGRARGKSDANGFVIIPTRLPRGGATGQDEDAITTVLVHVEGDAPRTASIEVPVLRKAEVVPTLDKLVVVPGESISIRLQRRPSAAKVPVIVELLSEKGLVSFRKLKPGVNRVTMQAPKDKLGVVSVRARPLHQKSVSEGTGGVDAFLVRPPNPSFPKLVVAKKVYSVGTTANLTLQMAPNAGKSWAAVLVRDLAAHSGEVPFRRHFLSKVFDQAILDPEKKASNTVLRTALADHIYRDGSPTPAPPLLDKLGMEEDEVSYLGSSIERGVLRDPFPLADELKRRGVGDVMRTLEMSLSEALDDGRLSEIATRRGGRSDFKAAVFDEFDDHPLTLGEGKLKLSMLYAADPSFSYDNVAKRVARRRLIELLVALAVYLDPGDDASPRQRAAAREPSDRWLSRMVERGLIRAEELADPWGNRFSLRRSAKPALAIAIEAANLELVSPGPDGRLGTRDDISDPFARAVPAGTTYALASGEDRLMEQLARLAPGAEVLRRLLEAYQRVTAEVAEEEIGDAVSASVSEGWGSIGTGSYGTVGHGSGSGYGYGSGKGGLRGRSAKPPSVRIGNASASGMSGFARVVRERFPSTLMFAPAIEVDPSGSTKIAVPLSEAITTHLVEVVVWSADGWSWSTEAKLRVDKETVVDAPVPSYATVGDVLFLPLRIGNRAQAPKQVDVELFAPGKSSAPLLQRKGVRVPGKDTAVELVELKLDHVMDGKITVGLRSQAGVAIDAVRRPIRVQTMTRRVRDSAELLGGASKGEAEALQVRVPDRATERDGSQVHIRVGAGLFALATSTREAQWAQAWHDKPAKDQNINGSLRKSHGSQMAEAMAIAWNNERYRDDVMADALRRITQEVAEMAKLDDPALRAQARAQSLLSLAPAIKKRHKRTALASELAAIVRDLRKSVSADAVQISDSPELWALSAAALSMSKPRDSKNRRVRELVRRVRRHQLVVGSHTWVASKTRVHETSALLAIAELSIGERKRALALMRTLATLTLSKRQLSPSTKALANIAARLASPEGPPSSVQLTIDGTETRVALQDGIATVPAASLSGAGTHAVSLRSAAKAPILYHLEADLEYGLPWDEVPTLPGSLVASIDGKIGRVGEQSKLELVVRNRSPRTIAKPVVEMSLPAGAELDEEAKKALRRHTRGASEAARGTLRLELAGLPPGAMRKIPIAFRWSVGGKLHGLGIAVFPDAKNKDVSISQPRIVEIAAAKVAP